MMIRTYTTALPYWPQCCNLPISTEAPRDALARHVFPFHCELLGVLTKLRRCMNGGAFSGWVRVYWWQGEELLNICFNWAVLVIQIPISITLPIIIHCSRGWQLTLPFFNTHTSCISSSSTTNHNITMLVALSLHCWQWVSMISFV